MAASGSSGITIQKYRGTLSLLGPAIDDLAFSSLRLQQTEIIPKQGDNDKEQHPYHITVLTKDEVRGLSLENQRRVDAILRSQSHPPSASSSKSSQSSSTASASESHQVVDLGLDSNNIFSLGIGTFSKVFWTVIIWAPGQRLRKALSLPPKHFHITLSSGTDVHDPPNGKGVESLIEGLDFSFCSSPLNSAQLANEERTKTTFDNLTSTQLDHLIYTLHLFQSFTLAQLCAIALILRDVDEPKDRAKGEGGYNYQYKGFLRYADACWALRKYKLAMLSYGCVWERVAFALRVQMRKKKSHGLLQAGEKDGEEEEIKTLQKIQSYALKKLFECSLHTKWGHVFRSDEVEDILSPLPILHDDVRDALMKVWGEELREVIRKSVGKNSGGKEKEYGGSGWMEDMEKENNPRSALFIPVFLNHNSPSTSSQNQNQNQTSEQKHSNHAKDRKDNLEFEFYRLPRFFSWVVPFHLALMSTPKSQMDVRALASCALGIRRVVTLTEEERLPADWFDFRSGAGGIGHLGKQKGNGGGGRERVMGREKQIVNTFMPVKNECPPSIEQMDCVMRLFLQDADDEEDESEGLEDLDDEDDEEEESEQSGLCTHNNIYNDRNRKTNKRRNTPMLIHCGGGKGRAGTVAACYLVSFGFGPPPPPSPSPLSPSLTSTTNQEEVYLYTRPKMTSQLAVTTIRALRPGSIETSIQERFVSDWASSIWKRQSVFPPSGAVEPSLPPGVSLEVEGSLGELEVGGDGRDGGTGTGTGTKNEPILVMLVGLPGSGKSWFARALMAREPGGWVYVSQDETGSREVCERVVGRGPLSARNQTPSSAAAAAGPSTPLPTPTPATRTMSTTITGRRGLILDRCNPTSSDRSSWISLASTWTSKVLIIHFDYTPALCESRAQRRVAHPTLQPGGRVRAAVKSMDEAFEVPGLETSGAGGKEGKGKDIGKAGLEKNRVTRAEKGVKAIIRVRSFAGAREAAVLVDGLGKHKRGGSGSGGQGVVMKFPRTAHLMDLGGAGGDDVWIEGGVDGFFICGAMAESASTRVSSVPSSLEGRVKTDDSDEVVDVDEVGEDDERTKTPVPQQQGPDSTFFSRTSTQNQNQSRTQTQKMRTFTRTLITEKLDGANMGLSLSPDGSTILVQNRSHYITSNSHAQFKKLDAWLASHGEGLRRVLLWPDASSYSNHSLYTNGEGDGDGDDDDERVGLFPDRYILYGEWLVAKHSVWYDSLDDWFVAFDLYDRIGGFDRRGGFVDGETLRRRCAVGGIVYVPVLLPLEIGDMQMAREEELVRMVNEKSVCGSERREGVVVKIEERDEQEEVGWVKARGKIVRGDFIAGNEHWTKGQLVFNKLKEY